MWELIKNNPIIKIVIILIAGIVGFGILFNLVSGVGYGNNMGHEGSMGYGGFYSTTSVIFYLYSIFCKFLILALVISIIALFIRIVYKYLSGTAETLLKSPQNDPYIRTTVILGISVITLMVAMPVLSGLFGFGMYQNLGMNGERMINGYYMNRSYGYTGFNLNEMLLLILKTFLFLSVIGVLTGLTMFFVKNYSGLHVKTSSENKCQNCKGKLSQNMNFCPNCGLKQSGNNQQQSDIHGNNETNNTDSIMKSNETGIDTPVSGITNNKEKSE